MTTGYVMDVRCECGRYAELTDSAEVYGGRSYGNIWLCRPCQAWVGCHPGTDEPLGTLADAELRELRQQAHDAFDPMWKTHGMSRAEAYRWLAGQLGIDQDDCHIGQFDLEMCRRVVEMCTVGEVL